MDSLTNRMIVVGKNGRFSRMLFDPVYEVNLDNQYLKLSQFSKNYYHNDFSACSFILSYKV